VESTDLLAAATEAHQYLIDLGHGQHHITLALGYAIEHNATQQQLPLAEAKAEAVKAVVKTPRRKKGAKA